MIIHTTCPICNKTFDIEVDELRYDMYKNGMHIQRAFPDMPAEKREMLITGIDPKCWDELFGEEEDE